MRDVYISGIGSYLPENTVTNEALYSKISGFDVERANKSLRTKGVNTQEKSEAQIFDLWVQQVTGVVKRSIISNGVFPDKNLNIEYMAFEASKRAIADAGLNADDIDHVIFSTYTGEMVIPSPVCTLTDLLGVETSGINLNGACSGFLDGLIDGAIKIGSGHFNHILVVASEYISNKIDYSDITTAILFSDGAGACVLSPGKKGIFGFSSKIKYSNEHIRMERKTNISMNGGPLVQRKAVHAMYDVSMESLAKSKLELEDITYIIPHQANIRILISLEEKLNLPKHCHLVKCIANTGNLSSSTIPVALDFLVNNKLPEVPFTKDKKILLTSVGGGYTYSAIIVEL